MKAAISVVKIVREFLLLNVPPVLLLLKGHIHQLLNVVLVMKDFMKMDHRKYVPPAIILVIHVRARMLLIAYLARF